MKKAIFALAMLGLGTLCWAGSAREDATDRLDNATSVMHEIMGMPDKGIPEEVLEHAKCVAVIPHMVKGGFVFGAKGGKGVATCRTANGWSAPAFITISGGSWGLQIGVEAVDVVLIIQNDKGMQRLLESNFQVGGDASAAAGPVGRHAEAGTDWKMDTEILTYSRAKGAFAGLTLEGASLRQDNDSRHAMYGRNVTTRALLLGKVPAPAAAQPFLAEIRGAKAQARVEEKAEPKDKDIRSSDLQNWAAAVCHSSRLRISSGGPVPSFAHLFRPREAVLLRTFGLSRKTHIRVLAMSTGGFICFGRFSWFSWFCGFWVSVCISVEA